MFFTIRKNFRHFPNYSTFSEHIMKTNNKFYNSIKKDCENYAFKKRMYELISTDNNDNVDNNLSITNYCNDGTCGFTLFTLTTFSIGIYSFLYLYRFKK